MEHMFISILLTSVTGSFIALLLVLIKPVTRKIFSPCWHYYMWLCVIAVMLIPVNITLSGDYSGTAPAISGNPIENTDISVTENDPLYLVMPKDLKTHDTASAIGDFLGNNLLFLSGIWLAGAILLFVIKLLRYAAFLSKLHRYSVPVSCAEISAYTKRKTQVRVSDKICSPLMTGIIKPTLLLPDTKLTPNQMHNILAHETTHLARNDILYKWLVSIVKCVHWFNPFVYFIGRQINTDCEIACDFAVTRQMNEQQTKEYIETILSLLSHNGLKPAPLSTGMTGSKKVLKRRFTMIKEKTKVSKKAVVISSILAVIVLFAGIFASGILNGYVSDSFASSDESSAEVIWPTESVKISNSFGKRVHPITGEERTHNGVDIIAPENSVVVAAIYGKVTETGFDKTFGNYVKIQNDAGLEAFYGHLSEILVSVGDSLNQKDIVGKVGKTGSATGPNLHFEIKSGGEYQNPEELLSEYFDQQGSIDHTDPNSVVRAFFRAFESGDYALMESYCSKTCRDKYFLKSDYNDTFAVFGMETAKLGALSPIEYLKGDLYVAYEADVSCNTPSTFSILQPENHFRIYLEKQEDGTYLIYDLSH